MMRDNVADDSSSLLVRTTKFMGVVTAYMPVEKLLLLFHIFFGVFGIINN